MTAPPIVALLTDFGMADWFVGSMKAVILSRVPECAIVDLCHGVEPGNVAQAAWILERTFLDFPPATVFCAVVDPGVGTERRAIVASGTVQRSGAGCPRRENYFFVVPDNGLLTGVRRRLDGWQCRVIANERWMRPSVSGTFHGRDVFAPAAAQVALEGGIENAGEAMSDLVEIDLPAGVVAPDGIIEGTVIYFDRFGNAITTIERDKADSVAGVPSWSVEIGPLTISRVSSTFADVGPGEAVTYWGSLGTLEIAVREGNAHERLGLRLGQRVCLRALQMR
jgi:hypothetical protein